MLQKESVVRLADNTGATEAKIMQVYPGDTKIAYSGHVARILIKRIKKIRV